MKNIRGENDEAERLYRRALELDPNDAINTGNFAAFLTDIRGENDEAERLYRRALELDPNDFFTMTNFTELLIHRGRIEQAKEMSDRAWLLAKDSGSQVAAVVLLLRGLLLKIKASDDASALGRLKTLLKTGFTRGDWSFDHVLAGTKNSLSEDAHKLYAALAAAILDSEKVAELEEFPRWQQVAPIPLSAPWLPLSKEPG
jgi:tetratricopeptide (TPR) repeat protein